MYRRSIEDPAGFWSDIALEFYWKEKWSGQVLTENLDVRKGNISIEVFQPYQLGTDFIWFSFNLSN